MQPHQEVSHHHSFVNGKTESQRSPSGSGSDFLMPKLMLFLGHRAAMFTEECRASSMARILSMGKRMVGGVVSWIQGKAVGAKGLPEVELPGGI